MPRFSANISTLYQELDFFDRFGASAKAGFGAVEIQFPYDLAPADIRAAADQHQLAVAVINIPAGDLTTGGPGIAAYPGREDQFKSAVDQAYEFAEVIRPLNMNVLAGWPPMDEFTREQCLDVLAGNLKLAAAALDEIGVTVLTEAVNWRDRKGFLLHTTADAVQVIERAGHPNLAIEYDLYHMQIVEGDLVNTMKENLSRIGHVQFADTPGRHEPGTGEINYPFMFQAIDDMGWEGWLGAEYHPTGRTEDSLGWLEPYKN